MENAIDINHKENIKQKIYHIREKYVMIDRDLAKLYNIETRVLIQKVKRNIERFPENFCFQLSDIEFDYWKSQNVMSKEDKMGLRRNPYAFTEQGIAMLSAIIKSDIAINTSIFIMNAFVEMRQYISKELYFNNIIENHENRIIKLENSFKNPEKQNTLFYEGQIYDSYSLLVNILNKASKSIIIIDNYAGKDLLDIIKNIQISITIISTNISDTSIKKYKKQYNNITFINNNSFHDRFIIIDKKIIYHSGASFKDLGKKCFAINKFDDKYTINQLLDYLKKLNI